MPTNNLIGQAGVYRVAAELLLRGVPVLFPASDDGVDLYTPDGLGIQVKAAHVSGISYHFHFRYWTCKAGRKRQRYGRLHPNVTHVVLWLIDDDRFIVLPRQALGDKPVNVAVPIHSLRTGQSAKYGLKMKFAEFLGRWDLFQKHEEPLSQAALV